MWRTSRRRGGASTTPGILAAAIGLLSLAVTALPAVSSAGASTPTANTPWAWVKTQNIVGLEGGNNTLDGLNGISCPTTTFCMAVGYEQDDQKTGAAKPLAEIWRGKTTWSISRPPNPDVKGGAVLTGVSCGTPSYCMAVGVYPQNVNPPKGDFSELWNGFGWSAAKALPVSVEAVSCVAKQCIAVGNIAEGTTANNAYEEDIVESWNGQAWSQTDIADVSGVGGLNGVSCVSAEQCLAVGTQGAFAPDGRYFDGTWSEQIPPNPGGGAWFNGVGCDTTSPVSCMAVGEGNAPLADLFDASTSSWTVTAPVALNGQQTFFGASCPSATWCIAVGSAPVGPQAQAWNGSAWTLMDTSALSGEPGQQGHALTSVSCPSTTLCFAVGSRQTLVGDQPEIASWGTVP